MGDPLREYADLYHHALECRRRVDAICSILQGAVDALDKRPERFRFAGLEHIAMPRQASEPFLDAGAWPTAAQIQQVLSDWHSAAARLLAAWEALWPRDRELLSRADPDSANIPRSPGYTRR